MTITIDTSQLTAVISKLKDKDPINTVVRIVATTMQSELKNRIHEEGKAANEGDIGQYSTKPTYIDGSAFQANKLQPFVGKPKEGKVSKFEKVTTTNLKTKKTKTIGKIGVFENGNVRQSTYVKNGYSEYKTRIGRNTIGKVNLSLSGQLNAQFVLIGIPNGWGLGWQDTEKYLRARALEKKYGKLIWGLSKDEELEVQRIANYEVQRMIDAIR